MRIPLIMAVLLISGCAQKQKVYYPSQITYFDEGCQIEAKQMVLSETQLEMLPPRKPCQGAAGCAVVLVDMALGSPIATIFSKAGTAVTAVISGSVVVAGNTLYWLEKQGNCAEVPAPKESGAAPTVSSASPSPGGS